jgi:hypothetical protein
MSKKELSDKERRDQWRADYRFINSDIREFSLESPDFFNERLKTLQHSLQYDGSGLTPLEFILRQFEETARKILSDNGYPIDDLSELANMKDGEHFYWMDMKDGGRGHHMGIPNLKILGAKQVVFSALHLREYVENNDSEEAAIETIRLMFAAFGMELADTAWYGHRKKYVEKKRMEKAKESQKEGKNRKKQRVLELDDQIHIKHSRNYAAARIYKKWDEDKHGEISSRTISNYLKEAGRRVPKKRK